MNFVAAHLGMPPIAVYEVASFYTMYDLKPVGKTRSVHLHAICRARCRGPRTPPASEEKARHRLERDHADGRFT